MAQNLLDTDSFNGTNATELPTYDANWVLQDTTTPEVNATIRGTPGVGIISAAASGVNYRTGKTWTPNQWAEFTIGSTLGVIVYVGVRTQATSAITGYYGGVDNSINSTYRIQRYTNHTGFTLATGTHSYIQGDVVNFEAVGTVLTLKVNGVTEVTYDTSGDGTKYSTGNPGLFFYYNGTATDQLATTWRAGSVGGSPPMFRGS